MEMLTVSIIGIVLGDDVMYGKAIELFKRKIMLLDCYIAMKCHPLCLVT